MAGARNWWTHSTRFWSACGPTGCRRFMPMRQRFQIICIRPDLLIRTSGEMRVSNFLLWQIAYAELYITDALWPDFSREKLLEALLNFQRRERRYGGLAARRESGSGG